MAAFTTNLWATISSLGRRIDSWVSRNRGWSIIKAGSLVLGALGVLTILQSKTQEDKPEENAAKEGELEKKSAEAIADVRQELCVIRAKEQSLEQKLAKIKRKKQLLKLKQAYLNLDDIYRWREKLIAETKKSTSGIINEDVALYLQLDALPEEHCGIFICDRDSNLAYLDGIAAKVKDLITWLVSKNVSIDSLTRPYLKDLYLYTKAVKQLNKGKLDEGSAFKCIQDIEHEQVRDRFIKDCYRRGLVLVAPADEASAVLHRAKVLVHYLWTWRENIVLVEPGKNAKGIENRDTSTYLNLHIIEEKYHSPDNLALLDRMAGDIKSSMEDLVSEGFPIENLKYPYLRELYLYTQALELLSKEELDIARLLQCLKDMRDDRVITRLVQDYYKIFENDVLYEAECSDDLKLVMQEIVRVYRQSKVGFRIAELRGGHMYYGNNTDIDNSFFRILLIMLLREKLVGIDEDLDNAALKNLLVEISNFEAGNLFVLTQEEQRMIIVNIMFINSGVGREHTQAEYEAILDSPEGLEKIEEIKTRFEDNARYFMIQSLFESLDSNRFQNLFRIFERVGNVNTRYCKLVLDCLMDDEFSDRITLELLIKCSSKELSEVIIPSFNNVLVMRTGSLLAIAVREENLEFVREVIDHVKRMGCLGAISQNDECVRYIASLLRGGKAFEKNIVIELFREFNAEQFTSIIRYLYEMLEDKSEIKLIYEDVLSLIGKQGACYNTRELLRNVLISAKELGVLQCIERSYNDLIFCKKLGIVKLAIEAALEEELISSTIIDMERFKRADKARQSVIVVLVPGIIKPSKDITPMRLSCSNYISVLSRLEDMLDFMLLHSKFKMICKDIHANLQIVPGIILKNLPCEKAGDARHALEVLNQVLSGACQPIKIDEALCSTNFDLLTLMFEVFKQQHSISGEILDTGLKVILVHKYPRLLEYTKGHQDVSPGSL